MESNIKSKTLTFFQVRYVYQCKGKNVTFVGQIFLGLYVACHAVTRLTVTIAMFSTAEDSGKSRYVTLLRGGGEKLSTVSPNDTLRRERVLGERDNISKCHLGDGGDLK